MNIIPGQISLFDIIKPPNKEIHINDVGIGTLFRYLRYGPHTVVPIVRNKCKEYLESVEGELPESFIKIYGKPNTWKGLPCKNCEYEKDGECQAEEHTYHYEYGSLVCDGFRQTIIAKPTRPICEFSKHECNKQAIWEIADTLDDKDKCPHVCCRKCDIKYCGARCNGSPEPSINYPELTQADEFIPFIIDGLKKYCEKWNYDWIEKIIEKPTIKTFTSTVCRITNTHYFELHDNIFGIEYSKKNETGTIYKCGKGADCRKPLYTVPIEKIISAIKNV